jgi:hypothetical protein
MLASDAGVTWAAGGGVTVNAVDDQSARRRWSWAIVVLLVVVAAAAVLLAAVTFVGGGDGNRASDVGSATSLVTVRRRSLSETTQFNGTLGYAGSYTVLARSPGTVTWLPTAGQVVRQGQVLFRVDGRPVVLLYGATPAYRALTEGATAADVTGVDVAQLNHDLVALGYAQRSDVDLAWSEFSWATRAGVEKLQDRLGVDQTGKLALGALVFLPGAARVTALQATLGAPAAGPVLTASSTARTVRVPLDPDLQSEVRIGDRVTITLPNGSTTPGRVTSVGKVATAQSSGASGSDSGPTVTVQVRPTDPSATGGLDQALVEVAVTDRTVRNVLAVPVTALLARADGGYSVEVVTGNGAHHLVRVTLGLFDDAAGMVQASGAGLATGQRVVVPGNE